MVRLFNNNQPFLVLLLLLYTLLLNGILFIDHSFVLPEVDSPLSRWLFAHLHLNYLVIAAISITLVFLQALLLTQIVNNIKFFSKVTFVPGMVYILVACMFREFMFLSPALIANTFIILTIGRLFSIYKQQYAYREVFDTGMLIGISTLIYFPSIVLFVAMFVALGLLRPFIWREWVIGFLGLFTTYFLVGTGFFWTDKLKKFMDYQFGTALFGFNSSIEFTLAIKVIGFLLICIFVATFFIFQNTYLKSPIQVRKYLILTAWMLMLFTVSFLFKYTMTLNHFLIITVPLSLVISYYLLNLKRKRAAEVVHLVLLLSILFFQYYPLMHK